MCFRPQLYSGVIRVCTAGLQATPLSKFWPRTLLYYIVLSTISYEGRRASIARVQCDRGYTAQGNVSIGGSVVEFSPATRVARVRFPADAIFEITFPYHCDRLTVILLESLMVVLYALLRRGVTLFTIYSVSKNVLRLPTEKCSMGLI